MWSYEDNKNNENTGSVSFDGLAGDTSETVVDFLVANGLFDGQWVTVF